MHTIFLENLADVLYLFCANKDGTQNVHLEKSVSHGMGYTMDSRHGLVSYDAAFTRRRSPVRLRMPVLLFVCEYSTIQCCSGIGTTEKSIYSKAQ